MKYSSSRDTTAQSGLCSESITALWGGGGIFQASRADYIYSGGHHRSTLQCAAYYIPQTKKGKVLPYSLLSIRPGADPGVQAVSPQVTWSHPPGGRLPLLSARPAVTFPAEQHHHPSAGTKLYCLVTEAHACKQLAQGCYLEADRPRFEHVTFWIASERSIALFPKLCHIHLPLSPSRPWYFPKIYLVLFIPQTTNYISWKCHGREGREG